MCKIKAQTMKTNEIFNVPFLKAMDKVQGKYRISSNTIREH